MPDQTRRAAQPQAQAPLRRPVPPPPVRRNLFQSQLTRRPTPAANSAEAMRLEASVDVLSDSDEIVVRDKDGEVEVEGPEGVGEDGVVDEKEEMEKDRKKLTEAVKHLRTVQGVSSDQVEYILCAVRASLRARVSTLAEDNWKFEAEPQPRH